MSVRCFENYELIYVDILNMLPCTMIEDFGGGAGKRGVSPSKKDMCKYEKECHNSYWFTVPLLCHH